MGIICKMIIVSRDREDVFEVESSFKDKEELKWNSAPRMLFSFMQQKYLFDDKQAEIYL